MAIKRRINRRLQNPTRPSSSLPHTVHTHTHTHTQTKPHLVVSVEPELLTRVYLEITKKKTTYIIVVAGVYRRGIIIKCIMRMLYTHFCIENEFVNNYVAFAEELWSTELQRERQKIVRSFFSFT